MSPSLQKKRRRTQDQKAELFEDQLNQSTSSFPPGVRPKDSINITHQAGPIASTPKASHSSISTVSKGAPAHVAISSPITPSVSRIVSSSRSRDPSPFTESNPLERNIVVVRVQQLPEADNNDSNDADPPCQNVKLADKRENTIETTKPLAMRSELWTTQKAATPQTTTTTDSRKSIQRTISSTVHQDSTKVIRIPLTVASTSMASCSNSSAVSKDFPSGDTDFFEDHLNPAIESNALDKNIFIDGIEPLPEAENTSNIENNNDSKGAEPPCLSTNSADTRGRRTLRTRSQPT